MTICPFMADQPFWGECIHTLGLGPRPIPQKKLSVSKLARALHEMSHNKMMRNRASKIGQLIQDENGLKDTVGVIEDILQRHRHNDYE